MSNHFPTPPGSWLLTSLAYTALWAGSTDFNLEALNISGLLEEDDTAQIFGAIAGGGAAGSDVPVLLGLIYQSSSPGDMGDFDQDAAEEAIVAAVNAIATVISTISGVELETIEGEITVTRAWNWQNESGDYLLNFPADVMTYPI